MKALFWIVKEMGWPWEVVPLQLPSQAQGGEGVTVKMPVWVSGHPGLLMVIGPVTAPLGTVTVMLVSLLAVIVTVTFWRI